MSPDSIAIACGYWLKWRAKYHRDSLLRFSQQKRAALLVCYLRELQQELLDRLLTSFDDLITSIFRRTESSEKTHHAAHGKTLARHVHTFRKVTKIVLDLEIPDEQVRPRIDLCRASSAVAGRS